MYAGIQLTDSNRIILLVIRIYRERPLKRCGWSNPGLEFYDALQATVQFRRDYMRTSKPLTLSIAHCKGKIRCSKSLLWFFTSTHPRLLSYRIV